jgi:hypothetical protein
VWIAAWPEKGAEQKPALAESQSLPADGTWFEIRAWHDMTFVI